MDKNAKIKEKVSRPGLYKQILFVQERPSIQKVCDSTSCDLVCFYLDTWQACQWSNATKRDQGKITFADVLRDHVQAGSFTTTWVPTEDMLADIFTKPLPLVHFARHRDVLGLSVPLP